MHQCQNNLKHQNLWGRLYSRCTLSFGPYLVWYYEVNDLYCSLPPGDRQTDTHGACMHLVNNLSTGALLETDDDSCPPLQPPDGKLLLLCAVLRPLRLLPLSTLQHHLPLLEDEPPVLEEDVDGAQTRRHTCAAWGGGGEPRKQAEGGSGRVFSSLVACLQSFQAWMSNTHRNI